MVFGSCPTLGCHSPYDGRHLLGRFVSPPQVVGPTKIFTAPTPVTWIYCVIPLIPKTVSHPVDENFPVYCKTCPVGAEEGAVHVKGVKAHKGHNSIVFDKVIKRDGVRDGLNYHSGKTQLCVSLRVRHWRAAVGNLGISFRSFVRSFIKSRFVTPVTFYVIKTLPGYS